MLLVTYTMPRPRNPNPSVKISVYLSQEIAAKLENESYNFASKRPIYGRRSQVIETALRYYFRSRETNTDHQANMFGEVPQEKEEER